MKDHPRPERPRSRVKTGSNRGLVIMLTLVVILTLSFFLLMRYKHSEIVYIFENIKNSESHSTSPATSQLSKENATSVNTSKKAVDPLSTSIAPSTYSTNLDNSELSGTQQQNKGISQDQREAPRSEISLTEKSLRNQATGDSYQVLGDELNAFYSHLDQQSYMRDFQLKEPSKHHFSKLLQLLIDNPPSITRETDDYFTLLKNTAHFFRILGKQNIYMLKGILDREKASFERIIKSFYALTEHPEYLKKEFSLTIPKENLYDYAGFFLNTIGGRLYLFRRDSASRMTISYYAVLIIDKANRQGNSRLGIDLRPSIDSLIEEMEHSGNSLKFKEEYLDTLYDLKESYGNRH